MLLSVMAAAAVVGSAWADELTQRLPQVVVVGQRPVSASSQIWVPDEDLELRPQGRPADLLRSSPGLVIGQHAGGGKADQTFLRGFDNDHGTDIAMFIDGAPVNVRSHAHGQGFADLHHLIPETVERMEVSKGPFQVAYGDFAVSGAVNFDLRESIEEDFVQSGGGPYDTQRQLLMVSPIARDGISSLSAFEFYHSDRAFQNPEKYDRFNTYNSMTFHPTDELRATVAGSYMAGEWHASGQIPLREVSAGRLDRFGAIDPSEGGDSHRMVLTASAQWQPTDTQQLQTRWYAQEYALDLFSNFTFFLDNPARGDGIEQLDERWILGSDTAYRQTWFPSDRETTATLGFQTRWDRGRVVLARQQARNRLDLVQDVDLSEVSYSPYLGLESQLTEWLRFNGGSRFDIFCYALDDRLSSGLGGSESDWVPSIKGNLIFGPWGQTEYFVNAGTGFHSNDARDVIPASDAETLPMAAAYELGVRHQPSEQLDLFTAFYLMNLESELVFVGDAGTMEARGRTRRWGGEVGARWQPIDWLGLSGDLTAGKAIFAATGAASDGTV